MSKGSRNRVQDHRAYEDNFDGIRWKSDDRNPRYLVDDNFFGGYAVVDTQPIESDIPVGILQNVTPCETKEAAESLCRELNGAP